MAVSPLDRFRALFHRRALNSTHQESHLSSSAPSGLVPREGLVTLAHVIYGLHAISAVMGLLTPAMIVTAFITGWPSIIAVILNYVKRSEVRGTWLDSHFSWQIRTFWFAVLWLAVGAILFATMLGIPIAVVVWFATGIWVLYRIIRGWLALTSQRPVP
jgi:uncharacterized membrane protein